MPLIAEDFSMRVAYGQIAGKIWKAPEQDPKETIHIIGKLFGSSLCS